MGIETIPDLTVMTRDDLLDVRNLGEGTANEIEEKLAARGLRLKTSVKSVPGTEGTGTEPPAAGAEEAGLMRKFGKTSLKFNVLGAGTIWLGRPWPPGNASYTYPEKQESEAYLESAYARLGNQEGMVLVDTAASYGFTEERLGEYFRSHPAQFQKTFIATKWGERQSYDPAKGILEQWTFQPDYSVSNLKESVDRSLKLLGKIDLLYLHMVGGAAADILRDRPLMDEMVRMKREGQAGIRFLGASISDEKVLEEAVRENLLVPFDVIQMPGSVFLKRPDLIQTLRVDGKSIVLNSVIRKSDRNVSEQESYFRLLDSPDVSMILTGSRNHYRDNMEYVEKWVRSKSAPAAGAEEKDWSDIQWFWDLQSWQREQLLHGVSREEYLQHRMDPEEAKFFLNSWKLPKRANAGIAGLVEAWPSFVREDPEAVRWHVEREDFFRHLLDREFPPAIAPWAEEFRQTVESIRRVDAPAARRTERLIAYLKLLDGLAALKAPGEWLETFIRTWIDRALRNHSLPGLEILANRILDVPLNRLAQVTYEVPGAPNERELHFHYPLDFFSPFPPTFRGQLHLDGSGRIRSPLWLEGAKIYPDYRGIYHDIAIIQTAIPLQDFPEGFLDRLDRALQKRIGEGWKETVLQTQPKGRYFPVEPLLSNPETWRLFLQRVKESPQLVNLIREKGWGRRFGRGKNAKDEDSIYEDRVFPLVVTGNLRQVLATKKLIADVAGQRNLYFKSFEQGNPVPELSRFAIRHYLPTDLSLALWVENQPVAYFNRGFLLVKPNTSFKGREELLEQIFLWGAELSQELDRHLHESAGWPPPTLAAGAEEPLPPWRPSDFGRREFGAMHIGGIMAYTVQPGDKIFQEGVVYETPGRSPLSPAKIRVGATIAARQVQTVVVPFRKLGRFAIGQLTFQLVPMGADEIAMSPEEEAGGGVAVAPMAKRYKLQVWLDGDPVDLDMVHLEDGTPVDIGREDFPAQRNPLTQFDLEGKLGRAVDDARYKTRFGGWGDKDPLRNPEWRIAVTWLENSLSKTAYLPRQALTNAVSRGDARVEGRPGWNVINRQFIPQYRQTGHLRIEIMGDDVVFSELGSTNGTDIEVDRQWAQDMGYRVHAEHVSLVGDLWDATDESAREATGESIVGNTGAGEDPSVIERMTESLVQKMKDRLIVIEQMKKEGIPINPLKGARFPFERPFQISFRIDGESWVAREIVLKEGQMYTRKPGGKWESAGYDYSAQEYVPIAAQKQLGDAGSMVHEGYRVLYIPSNNTEMVLNFSPYQIRISPIAAGAEESYYVKVLENSEGIKQDPKRKTIYYSQGNERLFELRYFAPHGGVGALDIGVFHPKTGRTLLRVKEGILPFGPSAPHGMTHGRALDVRVGGFILGASGVEHWLFGRPREKRPGQKKRMQDQRTPLIRRVAYDRRSKTLTLVLDPDVQRLEGTDRELFAVQIPSSRGGATHTVALRLVRDRAESPAAGAEEVDEQAVREVLGWIRSDREEDHAAAVSRLKEWLLRPILEDAVPAPSEFSFLSKYSDAVLLFRGFVEKTLVTLPKIQQGYRNLTLLHHLARKEGLHLTALSPVQPVLVQWAGVSNSYYELLPKFLGLLPAFLQTLDKQLMREEEAGLNREEQRAELKGLRGQFQTALSEAVGHLTTFTELIGLLTDTNLDGRPAAGLEESVQEQLDGFRSAIETLRVVVLGKSLADRFLGLQVLAGLEEHVVIDRGDPAETAIRLAEHGVTHVQYFGELEEAQHFEAAANPLQIKATIHTPKDLRFRPLLEEILLSLGFRPESVAAGMEEFAHDLEELGVEA